MINYCSLFLVILGMTCMYYGVSPNTINKKYVSKLAIALGVLLMVIASILNNKGF